MVRLWSLDLKLHPLRLPAFLTPPFPAYISFQSALSLHGMISQMPRVIYVASLGRMRRVMVERRLARVLGQALSAEL